MKKWIYIIFIVILFIITNFIGCTNKNDEKFFGEDFIFTDLDGNQKRLSDYSGKVVILDLWSTPLSPAINNDQSIFINFFI